MEKEFDFNSKTGYANNRKELANKFIIFFPFFSSTFFLSLFMLGTMITGNNNTYENKLLKEELHSVKAQLRIQEARNLSLSVQHEEQLVRIEQANAVLRLDYINKIYSMREKEVANTTSITNHQHNKQNKEYQQKMSEELSKALIAGFQQANNSFMNDMLYEKQRQDALFKETNARK